MHYDLKQDVRAIESIPQDIKAGIYSIYTTIFHSDISLSAKCRLLTPLLGAYDWSWRVVGISPEALKLMGANNYQYTQGITRAHILPRAHLAKHVFAQHLNQDEFFLTAISRDRTVLVERKMNRTVKELPDVIPFCTDVALFPCLPIGYGVHKDAPAFLERLAGLYQNQQIGTVAAKSLAPIPTPLTV